MSFEVATKSADLQSVPRERNGYFRIPVARRSSGESLGIGVHVARGAHSGPTLGLIGAVHGDAAYGSHIIRMFMDQLVLSELHGTVIAVPVANPLAFESGTRATGQGWNTDMNNMNRVFPGRGDGWITQRLAAALTETALESVDALIDYHCGGDTSINYTLTHGDTTEEEQRCLTFARLMGTDFIHVHETNPFSGTLDGYMREQGKLCIVAEQGGNVMPVGFDDEAIARVGNCLKALGMLKGEPKLPDQQLLMRGERSLPRVDHGGLFYPSVGIDALSTLVPGGTLLGSVVDPHSFETLQTICAPYEKSALCDVRPGFGRVNPGDYTYIIGDGTSGTYVSRLSNWQLEV